MRDREDWDDLHGYDRYTCSACGWSGLTDTAACDVCEDDVDPGCPGDGRLDERLP